MGFKTFKYANIYLQGRKEPSSKDCCNKACPRVQSAGREPERLDIQKRLKEIHS